MCVCVGVCVYVSVCLSVCLLARYRTNHLTNFDAAFVKWCLISVVRSSSKMVTLGKRSRSQSPKNSKYETKLPKIQICIFMNFISTRLSRQWLERFWAPIAYTFSLLQIYLITATEKNNCPFKNAN